MMYKSLIRVLAALCLCVLASCAGKEFKVNVKLPPTVDRTYRTIYYASDSHQGWLVEGAIAVQKGVYEAQMPTVNPTLYLIYDNGASPTVIAYAERGDRLQITGDGPQAMGWKVTGNKITERLSDWRVKNRDLLSGRDAGKVNSAVAQYVKDHPEDPVSAILLYICFDQREDPAAFARLQKMLSGDAREGKWADMCGRLDLMLGDYISALPREIVVHAMSNGSDTLRPGKLPMLLYFGKSGNDRYTEDVTMLRKLTRDFPDSTRRIVADISFETDSSSRAYSIRRDSLKGSVHGWMPLGVSDLTARRLGVGRIPYLIVTDSKGRVVYRGEEMTRADSLMRTMLKEKKSTEKKTAEKKTAEKKTAEKKTSADKK